MCEHYDGQSVELRARSRAYLMRWSKLSPKIGMRVVTTGSRFVNEMISFISLS